MAGVEKPGDRNSYLLVERHCPICIAATSCTGLCREELSVFRKLLGDRVQVERTEHIVAGGAPCASPISRPPPSPPPQNLQPGQRCFIKRACNPQHTTHPPHHCTPQTNRRRPR